ncbi:pole remodelling regulatory diguanylate cyclase [hydrocarbon metagenome]|uniref:Pole remodelling regulatory diguanylate cyclase n=1 Tax=hydrocarbon metagenome TaxID=938273 RepID=A0A0W8E790_9ZZZZ
MRKRRILVIDDEESIRSLLRSSLINEGYDVITAADGIEGFDKAVILPPDMILLDIMMPDVNGYQVLQRLSKDHRTAGIPVLLLTAKADGEERVIGLEAGAVDYITKPFYLREVLARMKIHLRLKECEEELTRKNQVLEEYSDLLLQLNARLEEMARMDELTQIWNRRAFNEQMNNTHNYSVRYLRHYSLIIIDLDHFKPYNDMYGHQQGDVILTKVAQTIKTACRETDFVARYGGEEIVVLLMETDEESSYTIAKRIITSVEKLNIKHEGNENYGKVTVSAGVSNYSPYKSLDKEWETVLKRADDALYIAKNKGRNRVYKK